MSRQSSRASLATACGRCASRRRCSRRCSRAGRASSRAGCSAPETIVNRRRLVCRLQGHAGAWPWEWRAEHLEEWTEDLALAPRACHVSTLRNYQIAIRLFCDFLVDRRYPWTAICTERLGRCPQQIVDERNLIVHTNEFEADPSRRPLSRAELEAFFDHCDAQVAGRARCGARDRSRRSETPRSSRRSTPGGCAAGGGPPRRRRLRPQPHKPDFGGFGSVSVRYGKAMAGGPPRRRNVLTVFDWAVEVIEQYLEQIRPLYGRDEHPALWLTERGGRVSSPYVSERFAHYRDELGLPRELTPHGLRHSYVTHLIEDGFDPLFVQLQVGHRHASSTAIYTAVNGDFKQRALADALRSQLEAADE